MKKIISIVLGVVILTVGLVGFVSAESTTTEDNSSDPIIQALLEQIEILKAQIEVVKTKIAVLEKAKSLKPEKKEVKSVLRIMRNLRKGMSGEDVKLVQEFLATDPDIYPEGLTTGYFGNLTEKAIKKFQKKAGIEQVGLIGPKTTSKINELLAEGVGSSGKVPPGLLVSPGIRKKLAYTPIAPVGQVLPKGIAKKLGGGATVPDEDDEPEEPEEPDEPDEPEDPDTTAPVISELLATSTTVTSTTIIWVTDELANSAVWYSTSTPVSTSTSNEYVSFTELVLEHSLELSGLTVSTTYYYLASSADLASNSTTSQEQSFTTIAEE